MNSRLWIVFAFFLTSSIFGKRLKLFDQSRAYNLEEYVFYYEDSSNKLSANEVFSLRERFNDSENGNLNFGVTYSTYWILFTAENKADYQPLLEMGYPVTDSLILYEIVQDKARVVDTSGACISFKYRDYETEQFLIELPINKGETKTFLLKVWSYKQMQVPLRIGSYKVLSEANSYKDIFFGIYAGIILVMMFYNLFIFFSIRDQIYINYVIYIFSIGLVQLAVVGYGSQFFWTGNSWWESHGLAVLVSISGLTFMLIINSFLHTKSIYPVQYKIFTSMMLILYVPPLILSFTSELRLSYLLVDISGLIFSVYTFFLAAKVASKGVVTARFFLVAWSFFLLGIIIFTLSNLQVIPKNDFTNYAMPVGSAIEALLLSFALAYRINEYKSQKLQAIEEKEKILLDQKKTLKKKVKEKTIQLEQANKELKRQALNAQIDPHFIFNSLNSIQNFILKNDKFQAQKYLSKFSRLMRFQLNSSLKNYLLIEEELKAIRAYLDLEQVRFQNKFEYSINVSDKIDATKIKIPTMLIIPFLENAIWHGVLPNEDKKGIIDLKLEMKGENLYCEIADNGIGYKKSLELKEKNGAERKHHSVGVEITKQRMQLMHEEIKSSYYFNMVDLRNMSSEEKTGTTIKFYLPYFKLE